MAMILMVSIGRNITRSQLQLRPYPQVLQVLHLHLVLAHQALHLQAHLQVPVDALLVLAPVDVSLIKFYKK
jgi:hypothetical protein